MRPTVFESDSASGRVKFMLVVLSLALLALVVLACGSPTPPTATSQQAPVAQQPAQQAPAAQQPAQQPAQKPAAASPTTGPTAAPAAAKAAPAQAGAIKPLDKPVTITMVSRVTTTDAPLPGPDWFWYKAVKEALNIDVQITFVTDPSQYLPVLQTRAAANDMPDLSEPDITRMALMADQGLLADWTPYLQYMPGVIRDKEIMELKPAGSINGKHYGLLGHVVFPYKGNMTYRTDWLAKLGLSEPKTLDEYFAVMQAFTSKDPDGNGKNDTYGFSAAIDNGALAQMDPIFGAFHAIGVWKVEDNKLVNIAISPERRQALEFINKMEKAGVMDPDWKAQKPADFRKKWREGKIGMFSDEWCAVYCANNYPLFGKANPAAAIKIGLPPVGPGGKSASGALSKANLGQMPVISKRAADAGKGEAIAKLLEWMNGPGYTLTVYGEEGDGKGYTKDAQGNIVANPDNKYLQFRQMSRWAQNGTDAEWFTRYNQDVKQGDGSIYNVYKDVLRRAYELPYRDVTQFAALPPMPADVAGDLTRTINEAEFQFATGARPFSDWDNYVKTVKAQGIDQWTKEAEVRARELGLIK